MNVTPENFTDIPIEGKIALLANQNGFPFYTLFAQQFDRKLLDDLGSLATEIRLIAKSPDGTRWLKSLLAHKRAMLYFSQPSSRTFLSFLSACQILGIDVGEVRDAATSSEFKGESREDSIRTFSSYFDMIIMRSPEKGLAEKMSWALRQSDRPIPIINAGSGPDQHPTQALLDIYTLQRSFENNGGIDGKTIVFIGDLKRGRTVRSLSSLLLNYRDVTQVFVAPEQLQIGQDILDKLLAHGVDFRVSSDMESELPCADTVYMTRIQDEWDQEKGESVRIDTSRFKIGKAQMDLMKPASVLMHPLPRRDEISTECDRDPRSVYWRQMRNGMWIRTALIATTFGYDDEIRSYASNKRHWKG